MNITRLKTLAKRLAECLCEADDRVASQTAAFDGFLRWIESADNHADALASENRFAEVFRTANRQRVFEHFAATKPLDDIRIHFCEELLANCQPQQRRKRGMYYTPQAVAAFMVRGVDELLQKHFQLEDGIASKATWGEVSQRVDLPLPANVNPAAPFITFFDPAAGAGVFPLEIIRQIRAKLLCKWRAEHLSSPQIQQHWRQYVRRLLPRLHACELMPAANGISRLLIQAELRKTDCDVSLAELASFRCGNALRPASQQEPASHQPYTVILGNPPYSNYGSGKDDPWMLSLLEDYKRGLNERKLNLNDDFIQFMRRAQHDIQQAAGILMFVTSNTYLEGVTHRRMRESLQQTFTTSYLLNLHGSARKGQSTAVKDLDESVFEGIQQGTCIGAFVRNGGAGQVHHAALRGGRSAKLERLLVTKFCHIGWQPVTPQAPAFYFSEMEQQHDAEYQQLMSICDLFGVYGPGIKTERDAVAIAHTREEMQRVLDDFRQLPAEDIRRKYELAPDSRDWKIEAAKQDVLAQPSDTTAAAIQPILYRPFDHRYTFYSGRTRGFIGTPGAAHMRHMLGGENLALHVSRTVYGDIPWRDVFITTSLSEFGILAARPGNTAPLFPIYLYPSSGGAMQRKASRRRFAENESMGAPFDANVWPAGKQDRRPNFYPAAVERFADAAGLPFRSCGAGDLNSNFGPEDLLHYIYAVFSSNAFRKRYNALLKRDYPRIPLPQNTTQFKQLVQAGRRLASIHLMQHHVPVHTIFSGTLPVTVQRGFPKYTNGVVSLNGNAHLEGVPQEVWEYFIGGYQICRKWLQDRAPRGGKRPRRARLLNAADIQRYQQIVAAIAEGIAGVSEIDTLLRTEPL